MWPYPTISGIGSNLLFPINSVFSNNSIALWISVAEYIVLLFENIGLKT